MGSFPGTYNDPTDYKLATKFIAKRLEKVLSHLIGRDHTCYIKGRIYRRKQSSTVTAEKTSLKK